MGTDEILLMPVLLLILLFGSILYRVLINFLCVEKRKSTQVFSFSAAVFIILESEHSVECLTDDI